METALVLPILLTLLFAITQFGLLFYNYIDLTSATRDGARKIAVTRASGVGEADARSVIQSALTVVDPAKTDVSISPGGPWAAGDAVTVTVTYPYQLRILGVDLWSGPMTAKSISRIE